MDERYLFNELDSLRKYGVSKNLPDYIPDNLNPSFELRPYQIDAFENYITWYEGPGRTYPAQSLFHMATGSGKTLIMAGLMLYLYKQGCRNFLFFVNLTNIVQKTRENFLNSASPKYLFSEEIVIDGERVEIKEVDNFQDSDPDSINICFTTTQGLHSDLWMAKENSLSLDDFLERRVTLISDEAHHLNVDTRRLSDREIENSHSWESTVKNILHANKDNILLEFTATCDLKNDNIRSEYRDKIVFNYPLANFTIDKYSKEIRTLRCDIPVMDRALQAAVLSQYRMKVFQDNRLAVKPVVLFKSFKIADSRENMARFIDEISHITAAGLRRLSTLTDNDTMKSAWRYFSEHGISLEQLAQELREDFSAEHCISANDEAEAEERQIALNTLEDPKNPYRAVFEVKKLDEGWDVLNLFDIVRMYETRQSGGKRLSPSTISEAQLIGRGARYFPFATNASQDKFRRKFDHDLDNPMRICEELYYHCQNEHRYIDELYNALRYIGIDMDKIVTRSYTLKEFFKQSWLYKHGQVFANERVVKSRCSAGALPDAVKKRVYTFRAPAGSSGEDVFFGASGQLSERQSDAQVYRTTIGQVAGSNYSVVQRALCRYPACRFDMLRSFFPGLRSTREFITSEKYLGGIKLEISSGWVSPPPEILYEACVQALGQIVRKFTVPEESFEGTREFYPKYIHEVFTDKRCNYSSPQGFGPGVSQRDPVVPENMRLDLSREDWFDCDDNFGTGEEKAFVAYFKPFVKQLKAKYDEVYLVRNERQLHIYDFDSGERFEPDYILFLRRAGEQWQVFIEPKGEHLIANDLWKEKFLLELENRAEVMHKFVEADDCRIFGFHFFNRERRVDEFGADMDALLRKS